MTVTFYDDITTMSDICVMAVSRLQGGRGAWSNSVRCFMEKFSLHRAGLGWGGIVMEQESMAESKGEDDIIPLYGVIGRNIAVFLPAI